MKIENQVCTLEQSQKLKKLGVMERSDNGRLVSSLYFGAVNIYPDESIIAVLPSHVAMSNEDLENSEFLGCAFTVAELGVMLPDDGEGCGDWYTNRDAGCYKGDDIDGFSCWHFIDSKSPVTIEGSKVFPTEAEARASLLIYLLENNNLTPEEANQRLLQS